MEINEAREHRVALEARLRTVAAEVVDEFQRRTNLYVSGVGIQTAEVTTMGDKARRSIVTAAKLDIEL